MTEKELKKLNRKQLLELLLRQTERADRLQEQLDRVQKMMRNKYLTAAEAGSIAEAALQLSGVFQAADFAAAQYLESIQKMEEDAKAMLAETEAKCRRMEEDARLKAETPTDNH